MLAAVVQSTLPEARAVAPAVVRTAVHGRVQKPVTGEAGTGDADADVGR